MSCINFHDWIFLVGMCGESGSSRFQPGEGPCRGLLCDYKPLDAIRMQLFEALVSTQLPHLELAAVELDTLDRVRDGVDGGPGAGRTVPEGRHGG